MRILLMLLTALLAIPAWAQEDAMKDLPGYVDFGQLNALFGEPSVEIAVGPTLLGLVSSLSANEDPETAEIFKRLEGVRIKVFQTAGTDAGINASASDQVSKISSSLSAIGWESVVKVNEPGEQVRIFMKLNGDLVEGITVMAIEEDEAVFINVIGNLKPAELEKVMDNFEVEIDDGADD
jgi:Domain of unknown function (DUF4252)